MELLMNYFQSSPCSSNVFNYFHNVIVTCKEAPNNFLATAAEYRNKMWNSIPEHHRRGLPARVCVAAALTIPFIYLYSYSDKSFVSQRVILQIGAAAIGSIDYFILSRLWNTRTKEINQIIENTHAKIEEKEGIALILSAPKTADHNFALADDDGALADIELIAKRFLIQSKTIPTPEQAYEAIEEVCKTSNLPVKVVYMWGHGKLQAIYLGKGQKLQATDPRLIEALKKTDASAHIILKSCSTGKLRSDQGISMADQLSISLPGRTVTANATDAGAALINDDRFPQGITLYNAISTGWDSSKVLPTHSFCVKENERKVRILAPFRTSADLISLAEQYKPYIEEDNKYKSEGLTSDYRFFPVRLITPREAAGLISDDRNCRK
jgi:hypothetical protein